jgi:hypothetical protein
MNVNGKKIFLIGFLVVLLVGIPLTVYLLQQQQEVRTRAEKSTIVTFSPDSTSAAPIQKNVGDTVPLDINVDPGKNLVSFVKLEINYDPEVLATASGTEAFQANTTAFPSILEGPVYTPGKIAVTLSVGPDPTKAIQQKVKAATVNFVALKNTPPGTPTLVSYSSNTQVLSIGSNDQASENVLSTATPATIAIGGATPSDQPIPTGSVVPTAPITDVPSPTEVPLPTDSPLPTDIPSPSPTGPLTSGTPNTAPVCSSLVVDRASSGAAPFSITFTANGSDTDGTVGKVTFNFGDGQQSDVTTSGGIGTASVNVQASHTYNNPGTYQATAVLTDSSTGISLPSENCKQVITVTEASGSAQQPNTGGGSVVLTPTMAPTGAAETAIGIGIAVMMLIVGGGLLFFVL